MMLSHYLFEYPIDFTECSLHRLAIESPGYMGAMVGELSNQTHGLGGRFMLSDSYNELDISRKLCLIVDPFALDVSSKDIISGLQKRVAEYLVNEDNYLQTNAVLSELVSYIIDKSTDIETSIVVDEVTIQAVLKAVSLQLTEAEDLCERVHDYVEFTLKYAGKMMVVIVGIDCFVSADDYHSLLKSLQYLNCPILLIESKPKGDDIPTKIIDADYCEIDV